MIKKIVFLIAILSVTWAFNPKDRTWVAIGDSITYLNEHLDESDNRITKGYMTRVVDQLPNIHYINQGHNGWTAVKIATEIENLGLVKADIYSIFLGTNDWWGGKPLGTMNDYQNQTGTNTVFGSFRIIINKLRILNPNAKIILITPMQRVDFVYFKNFTNNAFGSYQPKNNQSLEQFAEAIIEIGRSEKILVIDLYHKKGMDHKNLVKFKYLKDTATGKYHQYPYPAFIGIPFNPKTDEYPYPKAAMDITYDGLHPSDKGYAIIADMLVKVLRK